MIMQQALALPSFQEDACRIALGSTGICSRLLDSNRYAVYTWDHCGGPRIGPVLLASTRLANARGIANAQGDRGSRSIAVTKKEIVKTISEEIGLTQLKTKEIVQKTFDAIVETLVEEGRIELRNFGVFEVKKRAARRARNPRTGDKVSVPEKYVVTFKPGKEMEERVRSMEDLELREMDSDDTERLEPLPPRRKFTEGADGAGTRSNAAATPGHLPLGSSGNNPPSAPHAIDRKSVV